MHKKISAFILLFISGILYTSVFASTNGHPFILERSKVFKVNSSIVQEQTYEIRVSVPESYHNNPDKTYPVIYVLDGQWNFALTTRIVENLAYDGMMPEAIVAGITWGGEGDNPGELRTRDFVRPELPFIPLSGGAENFLEALTTELVPFVECRYRIEQKRVLMGASLAGLFTSYAMLEKPGFFDGYIAVAGSYAVDSAYLEQKLTSLAESRALRSVRSYMAVGSLDSNEFAVAAFDANLNAANLKRFRNKYRVFKNLGHSGVEPVSYAYGLQYIFKRPFKRLSEEFLQQYTGEFEGGPEGAPPFPLSVSVVDKGKIAIFDEYQYNEFKADSNSTFYLPGVNVTVEFSDSDHFTINSAGNLLFFTRVSH